MNRSLVFSSSTEYGKVVGVSLEDGEAESEGRVVVAVVVEPHIQVIPEYP